MDETFTSPVVTVKPEDSIFDTLRLMQTNFIKRIVVSDRNRPVGIVTERDINRFLEQDKTARALYEIPIKHVMQKNVITLTDGFEDHFNQCATRMDTFRIGSVVLVNDLGEIIGIVTKTDITKAYAVIYGRKFHVGEYMNKKVVTCRKSDSLKFALSTMNVNKISRLVVTDENGNPAGLITTNNFLTHSDYFSKGKTRSRDYLLPVDSRKHLHVEDLLVDDLVVVDPEDDLSTAADLMIKNKISGLPVVNKEKQLVGVISNSDIVRAFSVVGSQEQLKTKYQAFY